MKHMLVFKYHFNFHLTSITTSVVAVMPTRLSWKRKALILNLFIIRSSDGYSRIVSSTRHLQVPIQVLYVQRSKASNCDKKCFNLPPPFGYFWLCEVMKISVISQNQTTEHVYGAGMGRWVLVTFQSSKSFLTLWNESWFVGKDFKNIC